MKGASLAIGGFLAVVMVLGSSLWWFVARGEAPERASLPVRATLTSAAGPARSDAGSTDPAGTWTLVRADDVFVGYRIEERFAGETITQTAVGRTPWVFGKMVVVGSRVVEVEVTAEMGGLKSDRTQRDGFLRRSALETQTHPLATFVLTRPISLRLPVVPGWLVETVAVGDLTFHGVTRQVEIQLEAVWSGDVASVAGSLEVVLADWGIEPPQTSVVSVADRAELELQLVFERT